MFYTSVVLFAGFSVFMLSDFGGTVALEDCSYLTVRNAIEPNVATMLGFDIKSHNKQGIHRVKIDV
jgi:hypothetical protein